jgi:predicted aminopeptidase
MLADGQQPVARDAQPLVEIMLVSSLMALVPVSCRPKAPLLQMGLTASCLRTQTQVGMNGVGRHSGRVTQHVDVMTKRCLLRPIVVPG